MVDILLVNLINTQSMVVTLFGHRGDRALTHVVLGKNLDRAPVRFRNQCMEEMIAQVLEKVQT